MVLSKQLLTACAAAAVLLSCPLLSSALNWTVADQVLTTGIANGWFPGCSAGVIDATGTVVYLKAFGNETFGLPTPGARATHVILQL
jgi:hypothetical protein